MYTYILRSYLCIYDCIYPFSLLSKELQQQLMCVCVQAQVAPTGLEIWDPSKRGASDHSVCHGWAVLWQLEGLAGAEADKVHSDPRKPT